MPKRCGTAACAGLLELAVASGSRGEERGGRLQVEVASQHGPCDLLRVGLNDLENFKIFKSFEPALNKSHDYAVAFRSLGLRKIFKPGNLFHVTKSCDIFILKFYD